MQTAAVEQIFLWPFAGHSVLWMAGAEQSNHSWGVPHRALFPLEFWGFLESDDPAAVDRDAVLPHLLYFQ